MREQGDDLARRVESLARESEARHAAQLAEITARHEAEIERLSRGYVNELRRVEAAFQNSTSWRITAPMRGAVMMLRRLLGRGAATVPSLSVGDVAEGQLEKIRVAAHAPSDRADFKAALLRLLTIRLEAFLLADATIRLPSSLRPDVTIMLVSHNRAELTLRCLQSISEALHRSPLGVQVVIVDAALGDGMAALLARVEGAEIIRCASGTPFLSAANAAAQRAAGRHLLLLDNDAQLLPGSLEAAVRTLGSLSEIGAVGGRVMLPDGTLQEAGSIVWNDGSCSGYGRGCDPDLLEFMFQRDIDCCSAAFLLTRRAAFEQLGGFDERFAAGVDGVPDYCVRLWKAGFRVAYDPDVAILRCELGSARSDHPPSRSQFGVIHAEWLRRKHPRTPANTLLARTPYADRKRVLVIEDRLPKAELGAGYPRAALLIRELVAAGAQVTLFPMIRHPETGREVRKTIGARVEFISTGQSSELPQFLASRRGYYDCIVVCRPHNMRDFDAAVARDPSLRDGVAIVYDAEAIYALREVMRRRLAGKPFSDGQMRRILADELRLVRETDLVFAVSAAEKALFEQHGVEPVRVLGHAVETEPGERTFEQRSGFVFIGALQSDDSPNADSIRWFVAEVLPRLRREFGPDLRLQVVGTCNAPSILRLQDRGLQLLGAIEDVRPVFDRSRVMVAPTRYAAGIPLKVLQSAALGVPVVATALIAEELGWVNGREILAASDAEGFAAACIRLYRDESLWRLLREGSLRRVASEYGPEAFAGGVRSILAVRPRRPDHCGSYADWLARYDTLTAKDRAAITRHIAGMPNQPTISVIVPLYNTPEWALRRCIESVRAQLWPQWELCLADDASDAPHVAAICEEYARHDSRIRFVRRMENGHISAASNSALALATGEFVALLDHDDELAPHALYMIAGALEQQPDLDMIFSDEDKIDEQGRRCEPWFKSDWNYDLMLAQNAVVHLAAYRRKLVEQVGGFRIGYEGSQDYDLTLRVVEATTSERIRHLPYVLYHWRAIPGSVALGVGEKDYPYDAAARAIQEHLDRTGRVGARVERQAHPGYYRVHWPLPPEPPRVAVIVPTRDRLGLLRVAVEALLYKTEYPSIEPIVVDNNSEEEETLRYLEDIQSSHGVRVLRYRQHYSFAALNNWAVAQTDASLICLLNNDVDVITPGWLAEMVSLALRPEVGAVGCKLSYPNDTIQHAGIVVGIGGLAGHPHVGYFRTDPGYFGRAACAQRLSAVTAACLVMRREVFDEIGGLNDRDFAIAFNDVDLGLRLNKAGYAVVWTPHAELYHHESASLGPATDERRRKQFEAESANLRRLWPEAIANDPYYNPNLTISGGDWSPAFPPRAGKPWYARGHATLQESEPGSRA